MSNNWGVGDWLGGLQKAFSDITGWGKEPAPETSLRAPDPASYQNPALAGQYGQSFSQDTGYRPPEEPYPTYPDVPDFAPNPWEEFRFNPNTPEGWPVEKDNPNDWTQSKPQYEPWVTGGLQRLGDIWRYQVQGGERGPTAEDVAAVTDVFTPPAGLDAEQRKRYSDLLVAGNFPAARSFADLATNTQPSLERSLREDFLLAQYANEAAKQAPIVGNVFNWTEAAAHAVFNNLFAPVQKSMQDAAKGLRSTPSALWQSGVPAIGMGGGVVVTPYQAQVVRDIQGSTKEMTDEIYTLIDSMPPERRKEAERFLQQRAYSDPAVQLAGVREIGETGMPAFLAKEKHNDLLGQMIGESVLDPSNLIDFGWLIKGTKAVIGERVMKNLFGAAPEAVKAEVRALAQVQTIDDALSAMQTELRNLGQRAADDADALARSIDELGDVPTETVTRYPAPGETGAAPSGKTAEGLQREIDRLTAAREAAQLQAQNAAEAAREAIRKTQASPLERVVNTIREARLGQGDQLRIGAMAFQGQDVAEVTVKSAFDAMKDSSWTRALTRIWEPDTFARRAQFTNATETITRALAFDNPTPRVLVDRIIAFVDRRWDDLGKTMGPSSYVTPRVLELMSEGRYGQYARYAVREVLSNKKGLLDAKQLARMARGSTADEALGNLLSHYEQRLAKLAPAPQDWATKGIHKLKQISNFLYVATMPSVMVQNATSGALHALVDGVFSLESTAALQRFFDPRGGVPDTVFGGMAGPAWTVDEGGKRIKRLATLRDLAPDRWANLYSNTEVALRARAYKQYAELGEYAMAQQLVKRVLDQNPTLARDLSPELQTWLRQQIGSDLTVENVRRVLDQLYERQGVLRIHNLDSIQDPELRGAVYEFEKAFGPSRMHEVKLALSRGGVPEAKGKLLDMIDEMRQTGAGAIARSFYLETEQAVLRSANMAEHAERLNAPERFWLRAEDAETRIQDGIKAWLEKNPERAALVRNDPEMLYRLRQHAEGSLLKRMMATVLPGDEATVGERLALAMSNAHRISRGQGPESLAQYRRWADSNLRKVNASRAAKGYPALTSDELTKLAGWIETQRTWLRLQRAEESAAAVAADALPTGKPKFLTAEQAAAAEQRVTAGEPVPFDVLQGEESGTLHTLRAVERSNRELDQLEQVLRTMHSQLFDESGLENGSAYAETLSMRALAEETLLGRNALDNFEAMQDPELFGNLEKALRERFAIEDQAKTIDEIMRDWQPEPAQTPDATIGELARVAAEQHAIAGFGRRTADTLRQVTGRPEARELFKAHSDKAWTHYDSYVEQAPGHNPNPEDYLDAVARANLDAARAEQAGWQPPAPAEARRQVRELAYAVERGLVDDAAVAKLYGAGLAEEIGRIQTGWAEARARLVNGAYNQQEFLYGGARSAMPDMPMELKVKRAEELVDALLVNFPNLHKQFDEYMPKGPLPFLTHQETYARLMERLDTGAVLKQLYPPQVRGQAERAMRAKPEVRGIPPAEGWQAGRGPLGQYPPPLKDADWEAYLEWREHAPDLEDIPEPFQRAHKVYEGFAAFNRDVAQRLLPDLVDEVGQLEDTLYELYETAARQGPASSKRSLKDQTISQLAAMGDVMLPHWQENNLRIVFGDHPPTLAAAKEILSDNVARQRIDQRLRTLWWARELELRKQAIVREALWADHVAVLHGEPAGRVFDQILSDPGMGYTLRWKTPNTTASDELVIRAPDAAARQALLQQMLADGLPVDMHSLPPRAQAETLWARAAQWDEARRAQQRAGAIINGSVPELVLRYERRHAQPSAQRVAATAEADAARQAKMAAAQEVRRARVARDIERARSGAFNAPLEDGRRPSVMIVGPNTLEPDEIAKLEARLENGITADTIVHVMDQQGTDRMVIDHMVAKGWAGNLHIYSAQRIEETAAGLGKPVLPTRTGLREVGGKAATRGHWQGMAADSVRRAVDAGATFHGAQIAKPVKPGKVSPAMTELERYLDARNRLLNSADVTYAFTRAKGTGAAEETVLAARAGKKRIMQTHIDQLPETQAAAVVPPQVSTTTMRQFRQTVRESVQRVDPAATAEHVLASETLAELHVQTLARHARLSDDEAAKVIAALPANELARDGRTVLDAFTRARTPEEISDALADTYLQTLRRMVTEPAIAPEVRQVMQRDLDEFALWAHGGKTVDLTQPAWAESALLRFREGYRQYGKSGGSSNLPDAVRRVLAQFRSWLRDLWTGIRERVPLNVPANVAHAFDRAFTLYNAADLMQAPAKGRADVYNRLYRIVGEMGEHGKPMAVLRRAGETGADYTQRIVDTSMAWMDAVGKRMMAVQSGKGGLASGIKTLDDWYAFAFRDVVFSPVVTDARGGFSLSGSPIMYLYRNADPTTVFHEISHAATRAIEGIAERTKNGELRNALDHLYRMADELVSIDQTQTAARYMHRPGTQSYVVRPSETSSQFAETMNRLRAQGYVDVNPHAIRRAKTRAEGVTGLLESYLLEQAGLAERMVELPPEVRGALGAMADLLGEAAAKGLMPSRASTNSLATQALLSLHAKSSDLAVPSLKRWYDPASTPARDGGWLPHLPSRQQLIDAAGDRMDGEHLWAQLTTGRRGVKRQAPVPLNLERVHPDNGVYVSTESTRRRFAQGYETVDIAAEPPTDLVAHFVNRLRGDKVPKAWDAYKPGEISRGVFRRRDVYEPTAPQRTADSRVLGLGKNQSLRVQAYSAERLPGAKISASEPPRVVHSVNPEDYFAEAKALKPTQPVAGAADRWRLARAIEDAEAQGITFDPAAKLPTTLDDPSDYEAWLDEYRRWLEHELPVNATMREQLANLNGRTITDGGRADQLGPAHIVQAIYARRHPPTRDLPNHDLLMTVRALREERQLPLPQWSPVADPADRLAMREAVNRVFRVEDGTLHTRVVAVRADNPAIYRPFGEWGDPFPGSIGVREVAASKGEWLVRFGEDVPEFVRDVENAFGQSFDVLKQHADRMLRRPETQVPTPVRSYWQPGKGKAPGDWRHEGLPAYRVPTDDPANPVRTVFEPTSSIDDVLDRVQYFASKGAEGKQMLAATLFDYHLKLSARQVETLIANGKISKEAADDLIAQLEQAGWVRDRAGWNPGAVRRETPTEFTAAGKLSEPTPAQPADVLGRAAPQAADAPEGAMPDAGFDDFLGDITETAQPARRSGASPQELTLREANLLLDEWYRARMLGDELAEAGALQRMALDEESYLGKPVTGKLVGEMMADLRQHIPQLQDAAHAGFSEAVWMKSRGERAARRAIEKLEALPIGPTEHIPDITPAQLKLLESAVQDEAGSGRMFARQFGTDGMNFTMLSGDRRNFDRVLDLLGPYHYYYTRTGANWLRRLAERPAIMGQYMKLRDNVRRYHEQRGDSQSLDNTIGLGGDLWWNWESTLNPLQQFMRDFYMPERSPDALGEAMQRLPVMQTWGPLIWAYALSKRTSNPEAFRAWIGHELPLSRPLKYWSAAYKQTGLPGADLVPAGGIYLEAGLFPELGKGDYFAMKRLGRLPTDMVLRGEINPETGKPLTMTEALRAEYYQIGPIWDKAAQQQGSGDAGLETLRWLAVRGIKTSGARDAEVAKAWDQWIDIGRVASKLPDSERDRRYEEFFTKYPWFIGARMASKDNPLERMALFAQDVLSRVPPGSRAELRRASGIASVLEDFQAAPGIAQKREYLKALEERQPFMYTRLRAFIEETDKLFDIPSSETRNEFDYASALMQKLFAIPDKDYAAQDAFRAAHPLLDKYLSDSGAQRFWRVVSKLDPIGLNLAKTVPELLDGGLGTMLDPAKRGIVSKDALDRLASAMEQYEERLSKMPAYTEYIGTIAQRWPGVHVLEAEFAKIPKDNDVERAAFLARNGKLKEFWQWRDGFLLRNPQLLAAVTANTGINVERRNYEQLSTSYDPAQLSYRIYMNERDERFPNIIALQEQYGQQPYGTRGKFVQQHPELKAFWDWRDQYMAAHPEIKAAFNAVDAAASGRADGVPPAGAAFVQAVAQQQPYYGYSVPYPGLPQGGGGGGGYPSNPQYQGSNGQGIYPSQGIYPTNQQYIARLKSFQQLQAQERAARDRAAGYTARTIIPYSKR